MDGGDVAPCPGDTPRQSPPRGRFGAPRLSRGELLSVSTRTPSRECREPGSRPRVSDDNPFSEALFRTLKYRPGFPARPFASLDEAKGRVASFVAWYNGQHRHSALCSVTPDERHSDREQQVLAQRAELYQRARRRHPERWRGKTRDWTPAGPVRLGPSPHPTQALQELKRSA
ncbi:integrase core domain-containing protein [Myxococcus sp. RHSTA-1-4]|uniref:integrase core domain-containing protein n=1 Tax=Myxococcus sp. RHSTA-1-4 TaxID=2874601 RepID=UPI00351CD179|nr:integrase core domain-containing protein [Myxococcus sp. RHSTA-1-4]